MNEEQLKPIEQQEQIAPIKPMQPMTENRNPEIKAETIKELPTWNLEPPIEIKRGN